jgi:dolichyl-phosphate-mannose--protein O-mannosyl transferase
MGRRLFQRLAPAALAAFLLVVDGAFLVQARTAMLDIYLVFFTVLGAYLLLVDRQRVRAADDALLAVDPTRRFDRMPKRDRRFLVLAGIAFGLAIAVKWSGGLGLLAAMLATAGLELGRRKRLTGRWFRQGGRGVGLIAVTLVVLPVAAYAVTWIPWFAHFPNSYEGGKMCDDPSDCNIPFTQQVAALGRYHKAIAEFHLNLDVEHSYRAAAYTWPIQARPVVYYYETCSQDRFNRVPETDSDGKVTTPEPCVVEPGQAAEMLAVGNLALWWTFLPALAILAAAVMRRDRRAGIPLLFVLVQWIPWVIQARPAFSFYEVPLIPFVALGVGAASARIYDRLRVGDALLAGTAGVAVGALGVWIWDLVGASPSRAVYGLTMAFFGFVAAAAIALRDREDPLPAARPTVAGRWTIGALAGVAAALAIFFLPIWTGLPMSEGAIRMRWWFRGWI